MEKLKCIIVDDEPLAHVVLEQYISKISTLKIVQKCSNAFDAISYLQQNKVDLIFLDINMPDFSGIDLLDSFEQRPHVIITSAYAEYGVKSYEYNVADYLLKPFAFERFVKATNKVLALCNKNEETKETKKQLSDNFIFLKSDKTQHKVLFDDILYIQAYGNFVKVYTQKKTFVTNLTMTQIASQLPENLFIRVHRSYIASLSKIEKITGNAIFINKAQIPIGGNYKELIMRILK
jgi:two-component system, LytTR family, response regulator